MTTNIIAEVPGDLDTPYIIAAGEPITSTLTIGDHDWFGAVLVSGVTYTIRLSGLSSGLGTLRDPELRLRDSVGSVEQIDDDGGLGLDSLIVFTPTTTSTYYLDAGEHNDDESGTYTLLLSVVDDFAADTGTTGSVAVGGSSTGFVSVGDHDWFTVTLEQGATYAMTLRGTASGGGTLGDPELRLRDSAGTQLALDDDSGTGLDSLITFTAITGGTYYLDAGEHNDDEAGAYTLRIGVAQIGGAGDETFFGGAGFDYLLGSDGNDYLIGGAAATCSMVASAPWTRPATTRARDRCMWRSTSASARPATRWATR